MYLIDGNNLLYAAHRQLPGPEVGRQRLCELLGRWGRRERAELTVVFDGPRPPTGLEAQMRAGGVEVLFGVSRSADELIEEMIERSPAPANLRVVTGDRAIQSVGRRRRCPCIDADKFASGLIATPPPKPVGPKAPPEKPEQISPAETEEWLRRFALDSEPPEPG